MTCDPHDDHDREDQGEPAEPEPEQPEPEPEPAHARPGIPDMRAALAAARAILTGDDPAAHAAATEDGSCPACVAVAGISFGITLASTLAGDKTLVSEPVRLALLAAVAEAEQELGAASN